MIMGHSICNSRFAQGFARMGGLAATAVVKGDGTMASTQSRSDDMTPLVPCFGKAVDQKDCVVFALTVMVKDLANSRFDESELLGLRQGTHSGVSIVNSQCELDLAKAC